MDSKTRQALKFKLILASASPRRKELLTHLGLPFDIISKSIPEISSKTDPSEYCADIAVQKGKAIADDLSSDQNWMIVSADTIVYRNGKIFGKPSSRNEAKDFLSELSGHTHSVFTAVGIHLIEDGVIKVHSFVEESKVTFNSITPDLMELYLKTGDSLDKAGAYGIQGPSLTFISKVEGDYANVVGFPLSRFVLESKKLLGSDEWLNLF